MPSTNTAEIVEAVIFGIVMVGMWIFSIFWSTSSRYSEKVNNDMRVLKTITWLYGWAAFFLMAAALVLVLGAGSFVRGSDGTKVEWVRWVAFIFAGVLVAITVMFYYQFERFPDLIMWAALVAVSWAFGIGLLLAGTTKLIALFSVLGIFVLLAFGFWLFIQSRILWINLWDFLPAVLYILFSVLVWVALWLGPAAGKVIPRSWEVGFYVIVWFFMIMIISAVVWIFYQRTTFDYTVSSAVKSLDPSRNAEASQGRMRGRAPLLPMTMARASVATRPETFAMAPATHYPPAGRGRFSYMS